jgi:hypothetical protein
MSNQTACLLCGFQLSQDAKFCQQCGRSVVASMPINLGQMETSLVEAMQTLGWSVDPHGTDGGITHFSLTRNNVWRWRIYLSAENPLVRINTSWNVDHEIPMAVLIQKVNEVNVKTILVKAHLWEYEDGTMALYFDAATTRPRDITGYDIQTFIENANSDVDRVFNSSDIRSIFVYK